MACSYIFLQIFNKTNNNGKYRSLFLCFFSVQLYKSQKLFCRYSVKTQYLNIVIRRRRRRMIKIFSSQFYDVRASQFDYRKLLCRHTTTNLYMFKKRKRNRVWNSVLLTNVPGGRFVPSSARRTGWRFSVFSTRPIEDRRTRGRRCTRQIMSRPIDFRRIKTLYVYASAASIF